ncbi:dihydrofolate reductase family protein [Cellulomonas sp. HZM]|uniref:dihydrofolate reductase family protein n=1 Tax=Cellulomonas sp. HZM TaxID=1454010 RepID=UPI00049351FC|nr:dihydrofolate reductase family protein [Cellulomonas sp. HZM]
MLTYSAITSLDGYVNDASGGFGWAAPDDEVHRFVNDLERTATTYLYGRRMYEVMAVWQTIGDDDPTTADYARIWRDADKVVFSSTLAATTTPRTRLERRFDPDAVRAIPGHVTVGGPTIAAHALRAGIVDEIRLFLHPVVVGGGTRALADDLHARLTLVDERRFGSGVVHVRYRVDRDDRDGES